MSLLSLFGYRELDSFVPAVSTPPVAADCYTVLRSLQPARRRFDPAAKIDLKELSFFIKNRKWKTSCPFYLEWPYTDIVTMCQSKFTSYTLTRIK